MKYLLLVLFLLLCFSFVLADYQYPVNDFQTDYNGWRLTARASEFSLSSNVSHSPTNSLLTSAFVGGYRQMIFDLNTNYSTGTLDVNYWSLAVAMSNPYYDMTIQNEDTGIDVIQVRRNPINGNFQYCENGILTDSTTTLVTTTWYNTIINYNMDSNKVNYYVYDSTNTLLESILDKNVCIGSGYVNAVTYDTTDASPNYLDDTNILYLSSSGGGGDVTPPSTIFSSFQVPLTSDQNITLNCTDNNSGCKTINYSIDKNTWITITGGGIGTEVNSTPGQTYATYPGANWQGFIIKPNQDINFIGIKRGAGSESSICKVFDYTTTAILATMNSSGLDNNVSTQIILTKDVNYIIACGEAGNGIHNLSAVTSSFPINTTYIDYVVGIESMQADGSSGADSDTWAYEIDKIYLKELAGTNLSDYSFLYSGIGDHNIQYYSTDNLDNNEAIQTSFFTTTGNTVLPIITATINKTYGFTTDFNISWTLECSSNWVDPLTYDVNLNDTNNLFHQIDSNGTVNTGWIVLSNPAPTTFVFSCTDASGNIATTRSNIIYPLLFNLINEDTGEQYDGNQIQTNFYSLVAYTPDGNFSYDFNDGLGTGTAYYISPSNTMIFQITYKDGPPATSIRREINFSLLTDSNIPVCVPTYQSLYPQRFISNQNRAIILENKVAKCYDLAGYLTYAYDTGYSQLVYTIPKPYYLYSYSAGVLSLLALLDGTNTIPTNLDTLLFSRQIVNYTLGNDGVAFAPLINPVTNLADLNSIQIYYQSFYNDNNKVEMSVSFDGNEIFYFSDTLAPNTVVTTFVYSGVSGLTDSNYLTLIITTTKADGSKKTSTWYFSTKGNFQTSSQDLAWVAIISIIFFLGGMTMVSTRTFMGLFGVMLCLIACALCALALGSWWTWLLEVMYLIILFFIFLTYRPSGGMVYN
jgi:hypothetical protein